MSDINVEKIYLEYRKKVFGYISGHISNREDAEDLVSDVFLKVQSSADKFDRSKASVSTWIYTITRNVVIDHLRTRRVYAEIPEEHPSGELIEEQYIKEETLSELADALGTLSQEERTIVVMRYYDCLPLTEIADKLGMSYGMVKIRHNKALSALRGKMKSDV